MTARSADSRAPAGRSPRPPTVELRCPRCEQVSVLSAATLQRDAESRRCPECGLPFHARVAPHENAPLAACWVCGNREFFVQRDFNRQLGLYTVVVLALIVLLVMLLVDHRLGIYLLLGVALVDLIVYHLLPEVTVCYLCNSLYRRFPRNDAHAGFYLGLEEKHKKLRQEWLDGLTPSSEGSSADGTA